MPNSLRAVGLILVSMVGPGISGEVQSLSIQIHQNGVWTVADSPNFRCCCQLANRDCILLMEQCESWLQSLRQTWSDNEAGDAVWNPKCELVLHPSQTAYNRALNRPGDTSVGSTQMTFDEGRCVFRRIDLRADAKDWQHGALPHELTHTVLAERFRGRPLPRWIDEGIAMLSESETKRRERLTDLRRTLDRGRSLPIRELVRVERPPLAELRDAFYGQSLGLTTWFVEQSGPAEFANFVEDLLADGLESALERHYELRGISELQSQWDGAIRGREEINWAKSQLRGKSGASIVSADVKPSPLAQMP